MDARFLTLMLIAVLASLMQGMPLFVFHGLKAGIALAAVFFAAFAARNFREYAVISLVSGLILAHAGGYVSGMLWLIPVFLFPYAFRLLVPWRPWLSCPVCLIAGTFLLYGLLDHRFLAGNLFAVFRDGVYAAVLGLALYAAIGTSHDAT